MGAYKSWTFNGDIPLRLEVMKRILFVNFPMVPGRNVKEDIIIIGKIELAFHSLLPKREGPEFTSAITML
jgi:hypothetical protein